MKARGRRPDAAGRRPQDVTVGSLSAAGAHLAVAWPPVRQLQAEQLPYHVRVEVHAAGEGGAAVDDPGAGEDAESDEGSDGDGGDATAAAAGFDVYSGHGLQCATARLLPGAYLVSLRAENHVGVGPPSVPRVVEVPLG